MLASLPLLALLAVQTPVELALQVSPGADVDYSNAVFVEATATAAGLPLVNRGVEFFLRSAAQDLACSPGSWPATDAEGRAGPLKVRFVDGACGIDAFVAADPDGEPYLLEARTATTSTHAAGSASVELRLHREAVTVQLLPEHSAVLGEELALVATLVDPSGDVDASSAETQGRSPAPVAGATLSFYLDLNDDGDFGDADEALGAAVSDDRGVASVRFDTTPVAGLPRAGLQSDGVRAEFSGDARYKFAAGLGALRLLPAPVEAARTVLEVEPPQAHADGQSLVQVRAILRDRFGSLLGPDDDVNDVRFAASAGALQDQVQRDPATGQYRQALRAPTAPGTARVGVTVDGAAGPEVQVVFEAVGCSCRGDVAPAGSALVVLGLGRWRRRRSR